MTYAPHGSDELIEIANVLAHLVMAEDSAEARVRVSSALQTLTSCSLLEGELATEVVFNRGIA